MRRPWTSVKHLGQLSGGTSLHSARRLCSTRGICWKLINDVPGVCEAVRVVCEYVPELAPMSLWTASATPWMASSKLMRLDLSTSTSGCGRYAVWAFGMDGHLPN